MGYREPNEICITYWRSVRIINFIGLIYDYSVAVGGSAPVNPRPRSPRGGGVFFMVYPAFAGVGSGLAARVLCASGFALLVLTIFNPRFLSTNRRFLSTFGVFFPTKLFHVKPLRGFMRSSRKCAYTSIFLAYMQIFS